MLTYTTTIHQTNSDDVYYLTLLEDPQTGLIAFVKPSIFCCSKGYAAVWEMQGNGKGAGTQLILSFINFCKSKSIGKIRLSDASTNINGSNSNFYSKFGFYSTGERNDKELFLK